MRKSLRALLVITLWLGSIDAFGQEKVSPSLTSNPPIIYTGKLFGYFRWPDQQSLALNNCRLSLTAGDPTQTPNSNAEQFLQTLTTPYSDRILVGAGDNFAPELFSRTINDPKGPSGVTHGLKDNYVWSSESGWIHMNNVPANSTINKVQAQGLGKLPADNVGCFLARAGYDAVVPGKYDFYYGPEYLRKVARFLVAIPENAEFHKVRMLGANLTIETTVDHPAPRTTHREKHVRYSDDSATLQLGISDGDQVLPWLREVTVDGLRTNNEVYLCRQNPNSSDPDDFPVPVKGEAKPTLCETLKSISHSDNQNRTNFAIPDDKTLTFLQPGINYALCVTDVHPGSTQATFCARFSVRTPFFTYPDPILAPGQKNASYPEPYWIKSVKMENGEIRDVAIFGVVDPELNEYVGLLNYTWRNASSHRTTAVKIVDPVVALRQVLQYFDAEHPGFHGLKILLAQMPDYTAAALAAKFKDTFQVVVTQGEQNHHTEEHVLVQYVPPGAASGATWAGAPVVVVPKPLYDPDNHGVILQRHEVLLSKQKSCPNAEDRKCKEEWRAEDRADEPLLLEQQLKVHLLAAGNAFDKALDEALLKEPFQPSAAGLDVMTKLQDLTASALRKRGNADVILLQKRDWFDTYLEKVPGPGELQDALDRIFFKGDFQMKTIVTGKVLKQVMVDSKEFDREDRNDLALFHEKNRGLKPLGVVWDSVSGTYIVNGGAVVDDQLYSIVTSDFVASGDTGFPALKTPAVGDPQQASADMRLTYISATVCEELSKFSKVYAGAPCRYAGEEPFRGDIYFDELNQKPADSTKGYTPARHFLSWAAFWRPRPSIYQSASKLETKVQNRSVLGIALERASFSYDFHSHNRGSESDLAKLFSGVTVPGVNDSQSKNIMAATRVRATRGMFFGMEELEYQSSFIRGLVPSVPKNTLAFEGGVTPKLWPSLKETANLKGLVSLRWSTQLHQPYTVLTVNTIGVRSKTERTPDILGKAGLHIENQKSWIEAGYDFGVKVNTPSGYVFNPGSANPISCNFGAVGKDENGIDRSLQGCINQHATAIDTTSGFVVRPITKFEHGAFLNFSLKVPLPVRNGLIYTMENQGQLFFNRGGNRDLPVDTRLLEKWTHSISIPIVGSLSIVPKFSYMFFEDKVIGNSVSSWDEMLTLEYRFRWRSGIPWSTALRHASN